MDDNEIDRPAPAGVTRRRVVKTGAHAAWAVPVVTVLTTAPAFALNSPMTMLTVTDVTATRAATSPTNPLPGPMLTVTASINNTGAATTQGVSIVVTITPTAPIPGVNDFSTTTTTGGVKTNPNPTATSVQYTFTPANQLAAGLTRPLSQVFTLSPNPAPGSVVVSVMANNATTATANAVPFA